MTTTMKYGTLTKGLSCTNNNTYKNKNNTYYILQIEQLQKQKGEQKPKSKLFTNLQEGWI